MSQIDWKQPALYGGLITGLLSAIPGIQMANCCFCAWALVGGAVAAKMLIDRTPRPIKSSEGAQVGLIAGLIGAAISILISALIVLSGVGNRLQLNILERMRGMINDPNFQEQLQSVIDQQQNMTTLEQMVSSIPAWLIYGLVLTGFTVLGGLIGVALFEKRKDQPPPQSPPPQYPPQYPGQYPTQNPPQDWQG